MPRMLKDSTGALYYWNAEMAKHKNLYTEIMVDEEGNQTEAPPEPQSSVGIGETEVTDYVPGQDPPTSAPPLATSINEPPQPEFPPKFAEDAQPAGKRGRKPSMPSSDDDGFS